jgi:hypothetical protein
MKKLLLSLIIGLAGIPGIEAQITPAQNALDKAGDHFFIENKGQWPAEVLYLARIGGLDAWITRNGVLYDFYRLQEVQGSAKTEEVLPNKFEHKDFTKTGHRVLYKLQGNNSLVNTEGKEKQAGYYNYLIGNDPGKHASNVGLYKEALLKDVYHGIDLRYYFDKGNLRYDYVVHPGADPSQIGFALGGTEKTFLDTRGDLVFHTRFGQVALAELKTYQGTKDNEVSSNFVKTENGWSIAVGNYDSRQTLIIDPLIYSTYLGGYNEDNVNNIAVDGWGNAYLTGTTPSPNYDTTSGAYQTSYAGKKDAFVTKLNASGTALVYSTYLGGSNDDVGSSIAIDASGNAYILGLTGSTNYNITWGAFQKKYAGGDWDAFVTKLNSTGTALVYSTYLGGSGNEYGYSIAVNASGNAYVTGGTPSSNYPTTPGTYQTSLQGRWDVYVTKLNTTGTALVYSTLLGGSSDDFGCSIAIDASGNAYITGYTESGTYPTTSGAYKTISPPSTDAFVTKLNATGTALVYSTYLGGSGSDLAFSIAINASGNAYVTGTTLSTDYNITTGAYKTSHTKSFDAFVTKLNTTGTALVYSTYLGGSDQDLAYSVAVDVSGNAYVTGSTHSLDYDTTAGALQTRRNGNWDGFLTKLNATGTALAYSTYLGGTVGGDEGRSIAVDASGSAYITGWTGSANYYITSGAYQTGYGGSGDIFVTKICLVEKATISLALNAGPDLQSLCIHTPITNIAYAITNATFGSVTGLPAGVTASFSHDAVTISGTPVESGTYDYTVFIYGGCSIAAASGSITVKANTIRLFSASGTDSQSLCVHSAMAKIRYATTGASGATFTGLPDGTTGGFAFDVVTISGTPTAIAIFNYTITLTGGCGTITAKGSMTVTPENTISLSSGTGTDSQSVCTYTAITKITYTTTDATGATITGLPAGVSGSFAANAVTISGTPTASGTHPYTVTLTGGCGLITAKGSITANTNTLTLLSASGTDSQSLCMHTAITNITYSTTGASSATVTGLPAGLSGSFAANTVTISGTPTASGTYNYTVTLTGGCGTITAKGSITVKPNNTISLSSAPGTDLQSLCINSAITNITYSTTGASGATVTGLPAGVSGSFAANAVTISGTPTASGTYSYTLTLTGGCGLITAKGSITVNANTLRLSSPSGTDSQSLCMHTAITNITYSTTGASSATVTGLPAGLSGSFAANTVTISGTPTASGTYNYSVSLTGGCGTITAKGSITVKPNNTISLSSAPGTDLQSLCINSAITNITYSTTGASGATVTGLPAGVSGSFAANTVTISGTPTASGTYNYTVTLTGGCGTITAKGSINVNANTIRLTSASGTDAQNVKVYSSIANITYATTGATGATVTGLPAGVTVSFAANVVTISGTPTAIGTFTYTVILSGGCGTIKTTGRINVESSGRNNQTNRQVLQIFPNPSDIEVSIKGGAFTSSVQIEIIDALGRIIQAVYSLDKQTIKLQVSSLASGMYCIRITDAGRTFQGKIIVRH